MADYNYFSDDNKDDEMLFNPNANSESSGIKSVVDAINNLLSDKLISKSVSQKLSNASNILNGNDEMQLKINKVQEILNEITEDSNLPSFVKTQIWNIAGMLETIE